MRALLFAVFTLLPLGLEGGDRPLAEARATSPEASRGAWRLQASGSTAELRGVSAPGGTVAWATGARGTVLRTTDGLRWEARPVPGAAGLDFRDVHALDARRAWILAAGPGASGRIYRTADGGATWALQFTNPEAEGFLDAFAFWDAQRGLALGDPVGGRFQVLTTADGGATWTPVPAAGLPPALEGEGAFAASGACLVTAGSRHAWFVTGGARVSRVFRTTDRGRTWAVSESPVPAGGASIGLFAAAFAGARRGVIVGGDYRQKAEVAPTGALTEDGGRTWRPAPLQPAGFYSAVTALPGRRGAFLALGLAGTSLSEDGGRTWRALDADPFNAVAFGDARHGWAVGPQGRIAIFEP